MDLVRVGFQRAERAPAEMVVMRSDYDDLRPAVRIIATKERDDVSAGTGGRVRVDRAGEGQRLEEGAILTGRLESEKLELPRDEVARTTRTRRAREATLQVVGRQIPAYGGRIDRRGCGRCRTDQRFAGFGLRRIVGVGLLGQRLAVGTGARQ